MDTICHRAGDEAAEGPPAPTRGRRAAGRARARGRGYPYRPNRRLAARAASARPGVDTPRYSAAYSSTLVYYPLRSCSCTVFYEYGAVTVPVQPVTCMPDRSKAAGLALGGRPDALVSCRRTQKIVKVQSPSQSRS